MKDKDIKKYFNSLYIKLLDVKYDLKITQKEFLALNEVHNLITRQQAKIEKLKNENFILSQKIANIFEITEAYGRGKSEAVKEFADRLKKDIFNTEYHIDRYYRRSIDKLVKEMDGENNSDE